MPVIEAYHAALKKIAQHDDFPFNVSPIHGEVEVLQIVVKGREDNPIYMSISQSQLLCIAHLFREEDVKPEQELPMLRKMIAMNIPMPLSSFGKMRDLYVVFGALAADSALDDVLLELKTLSDNALEASRLLEPFLRQR